MTLNYNARQPLALNLYLLINKFNAEASFRINTTGNAVRANQSLRQYKCVSTFYNVRETNMVTATVIALFSTRPKVSHFELHF